MSGPVFYNPATVQPIIMNTTSTAALLHGMLCLKGKTSSTHTAVNSKQWQVLFSMASIILTSGLYDEA